MAAADFKTPVRASRRLAAEKIVVPPSPLLKKLGYGTGVAVYEMVRSPRNNTERSPWAIKKLLKNKKRVVKQENALEDEAKILRQLNHPNVVQFRAYIKGRDGNGCLAMEECGGSLGDLIEERYNTILVPFEPNRIYKVSGDVSRALDYLHNEALILHADLKSFNVLVKGDFKICKLCDFDVALPLKKNGTAKEMNAVYIGTPSWSAPEVLCSDKQIITTKADIYAFGMILWEMLCLEPPPYPEKPRRRPDFLKEMDIGDEYNIILEIFYCCTESDPNKRPTARDLVSILKEIDNKNA